MDSAEPLEFLGVDGAVVLPCWKGEIAVGQWKDKGLPCAVVV